MRRKTIYFWDVATMEIENVIFDMDGVLYRGEGAIAGAAETVNALSAAGKKVYFLTNNGSKTRKHFHELLEEMGFECGLPQVYSTSYGTGKYIRDNFPGKSVYALDAGMREELESQGIKCVEDESAEVVVVGLDRQLTYEKLTVAFKAIKNGAEFIASNDDPMYPVEEGFIPGAGAMVGALSYSTGKKPFVIGKPHRLMLDIIVKEHGLLEDRTLMVGDKLETDIMMAKKEKMKSILVLTGVTTKAEAMESSIKPDAVVDSVKDVSRILEKWAAQK